MKEFVSPTFQFTKLAVVLFEIETATKQFVKQTMKQFVKKTLKQVDEELLDVLAHEAYEDQDEYESYEDERVYYPLMEKIRKTERYMEECLEQHFKDTYHGDEMDELATKYKKEKQNKKEWKFQIKKLEEEPIVEEASMESLMVSTKKHEKKNKMKWRLQIQKMEQEQNEKLLLNSHINHEMEIEDCIKCVEQHVLPMDKVIKDVDECVKHQESGELEQDEMINKLKEQVWTQNEMFYQDIEKIQRCNENTNPFFFDGYKF